MLSHKRRGKAHPIRLGHYEVFESIGRGPKGAVYRGVDRRNGDEVALRAIPRELVERLGKKARWFERFTREASTASSVNHPHLAAILDHGFEEDQRCLFVVNELAPGPPLARRLEEGPLSVGAAVKLTFQVATALTALHNGGVVHRMVRPSNIHLDEKDNAVVTDVGVAGMLAWDLMPLRPRLVEGGPYLSPEQVRLGRVDDRSDQFSLGLILFEALTGRHLLEGDSPSARVHSLLSRPLGVNLDPNLEERQQLTDILEVMLAMSPEERFQTDGELQTALRDCGQDLGVEL
jgi:serine/threonine protein kinase